MIHGTYLFMNEIRKYMLLKNDLLTYWKWANVAFFTSFLHQSIISFVTQGLL